MLLLLVLTLRAGTAPIPIAPPDPADSPALSAAAGVVTTPPAPPGPMVRAQLAKLPLIFAPSAGRAGADVRYVSLGPGPRLELTDSEVRLATPQAARSGRRVSLALAAGARPRRVEAEELTPATLHDYNGPDQARWRRDVPTYHRVVYRDLYPATDLVFHGSQGRAEFDFVLRPGATPRAIGLDVRGADRVTLEGAEVVVRAGDEIIRLHEPVVYQEGAAGRERVDGRFTVKGRRIGFEVAAYDRTRPLVIDPVVTYATYLGGEGALNSGGGGHPGVGVDAAGNIYLATSSDSFFEAAQVVKLSADGQRLLYAVDLGGMETRGFVVDPAGNAYLIGLCLQARSGLELLCPAFRSLAHSGGALSQGDYDTSVAKLGPTGTLLFASSMGGRGTVVPGGIAVDRAGNIYASAWSTSNVSEFPLTRPPYNSPGSGMVIEAIAADTSRFLWVTAISSGGLFDPSTLAVDSTGAVYVTGASADTWVTTPGVIQPGPPPIAASVVAKLAADGSLVYGTFFGNERTTPRAIAVDDAGNAYITGEAGPGLPTVNARQPMLAGGATDAFVAKLNPTATALVFSTYLGGKGFDTATDIGRDARGNVYIAGSTSSTDFPQHNPLPPLFGTAGSNFVAGLTGDGAALVYSTYFAGVGTGVRDMHVTPTGTVYLTGFTTSPDFPTVDPFQAMPDGRGSAFIAQLDPLEPSVVFTRPATGATVGGTVWTDVWAENFTGTANTFTLSIGGTTVATGTGGNHVTLPWNSLAVPNGPVTLTATVRSSRNQLATATRSLIVANAAPLVAQFTAPAAGASVRGTTTIGMSATGASGPPIAFTLTVDGTQRFATSGTSSTALFKLDTTTLADGVHTLGLTVRDGADRTATTTRVLTVANSPGTFSVIVTSPPTGAASTGRAWADVWLEGASPGSRTFTLSIDGTVVGTATDSRNHVTIPWDSTKVANGLRVLTVRVRDASGRTGLGARDVTVQNGPIPTAANPLRSTVAAGASQ